MKNEILQAIRENNGLTQKEVAKKVGVSERMYQKYEYGTTPNAETAIRIAKALNSTVEELWGE